MKGWKYQGKNTRTTRTLCVALGESQHPHGFFGRVLVAMTDLLLNTREIPAVHAQCDWENRTSHRVVDCVHFLCK